MINVKTESNKNRNFDHDSLLDFVSAVIVVIKSDIGNAISTHEVDLVDVQENGGGILCECPNGPRLSTCTE